MANRLAGATSPYLLQHQDNPVDWYPWSTEAFERARREDKPVFVSIGYASCHWCHVMAHESFEDPATAEVLNRHFVSIKVDREERPDIDAIYMNALQSMTGSGGWPLNVVTTPDGEPFFAGTYFAPDARYGRPPFRSVLESVVDAWRHRRQEVTDTARSMRERLQALAAPIARSAGPQAAADELAAQVLGGFESRYDARFGGFGGAPKFPPHGALAYLLARPEPGALAMARGTLEGMARGGIFDQLGGGFSRYSVDERWAVPHFEKMLYDNAQLLPRYAEAFRRTGDAAHARVVRQTLAWLEREMVAPEGGFYSALDADSEGEEGRFYAWDEAEFEAVAGADASLAKRVYGVTSPGPFEGRNVLRRAERVEDAGRTLALEPAEAEAALARAGAALLAHRERRVRPGLDDKILTSWNGMMLEGLADVARLLGDPTAERLARANVAFVRARLWQDGRLFHAYRAGSAHIDGLLEDYAHYGLGLLALYRWTLEPALLRWAFALGEAVRERFEDRRHGGYFTVAEDAEALLVRPRSWQDGAVPADNAAAAALVLQLGRIRGDDAWVRSAERAIVPLTEVMGRYPQAFGASLLVHARLQQAPREVVLVGEPERDDLEALEAVWRRHARPDVAVLRLAGPDDPLASLSALAEGRERLGGRATAYVCEGGACQLPVTDPADFEAQLEAAGITSAAP